MTLTNVLTCDQTTLNQLNISDANMTEKIDKSMIKCFNVIVTYIFLSFDTRDTNIVHHRFKGYLTKLEWEDGIIFAI
jgi:hypothetical protein